jgi:hypothetical protein
MRRIIALALCWFLPLSIPSIEIGGDSRDPDLVRQIRTVAAMRQVEMYLSLYREDHPGENAPSFAALTRAYSMPPETAVDGWGRPLYYYATPESYVLVSFGRSDVPRAQRSTPGGVSPMAPDWDENIVMIDGEWAQTPFGVDR